MTSKYKKHVDFAHFQFVHTKYEIVLASRRHQMPRAFLKILFLSMRSLTEISINNLLTCKYKLIVDELQMSSFCGLFFGIRFLNLWYHIEFSTTSLVAFSQCEMMWKIGNAGGAMEKLRYWCHQSRRIDDESIDIFFLCLHEATLKYKYFDYSLMTLFSSSCSHFSWFIFRNFGRKIHEFFSTYVY